MIKNILTTKKRKSWFPFRKKQKGLQYIKEACCTLPEILERYATEIPDKTAIIYHHKKINYHEFNTSANSLANELLNIGVKRGDRIGLMLPRIPELVISFMGIAKAGAIVAPINYELTEEGIRAIFKNIMPACLIIHSTHLDQAIRALPQNTDIPIILVGEYTGCGMPWNDIINAGKTDNPNLDIQTHEVVYLNYTSGSTGNSKGAETTHSNIYWNTIAAIDILGLKSDDVHLCMFAPFAHPHEIFARSLFLGGTIALVEKIYPKSIAEAISSCKVTCMMGLAPLYENLLDILEHGTFDVSSLRIPESGGMYTRTNLIEKFKQKTGVPIIPVWGSTETTGIAIANRPGDDIPKRSIGKPCPTYEIKIVDENNNELPQGEIGEMLFKGPAVVQNYYGNAGNTCSQDGWYHSGDLGMKDEHGYFYFIERKSGMMKVAGLKVYPQEIERVLLEHPSIKEIAVISVKDRLRGEIPKAVAVLQPGENVKEHEILDFCKGRLPHYKLPRIIEIRKDIPKSGSGKINKNILILEHV
ncbi:AMP-binding protein [Candidatus Kuenenia sp.]|uniref:class I adenylate-forming enzyme family protein n=1 Tax=Candidatus Kuenenia sp. TaxID=2499824 RepID=UPI00321FE038